MYRDLPHSNTAFPYAAWWEDLRGQILSLPAPGSQAAGLWPKCADWTLLPGILTWLEWPMVQSESGVTQQSMEQCLGGASLVSKQNAPVVILAGPGLAPVVCKPGSPPLPERLSFNRRFL